MQFFAAALYGAHQIFTRLAADRIGEGLGGFVVEASAALSILIYLAILWFAGRWNQKFSGAGLDLFAAYRCLRRCQHDRVFPSFPKRWSAFRRSGNPCGRRYHHGVRGHLVFPRSAVVAANGRRCVCDYWSVFAAQINLDSLRKKLESNVSHCVCVADNVASAREEQVQMLTQFPSATDFERQLGTAATFFWRIAEQFHT